jgi:threonylcarbamoyladenosine tRNA methylthiotransferase MtaB
MRDVEIVTFGCRLNALESESMRAAAAQAGLHDAVVVNTCAVTAEAERQARQAIRRARRHRPGARIIVTGCAATLAPERYAALADLVLDNQQKLRPESYGIGTPHPVAAVVPDQSSPSDARARAYLQVQQGCDHRCTFCIIPFARGPSRSVSPGRIVAEARDLVRSGAVEIVLTGVDLTAYGADLPGMPTLGTVVRQLLDGVPELGRLRLSSLDPGEIDEPLWRLIGDEPRLMPHLHFSLQSGDDLILKRMKRRHSRAQAIVAASRACALRPGIALGADLIAGFPTESDEMFGRSLDLIGECGLTFVHVFPYSKRPGTPAARMPEIDPAVVRERARLLREAGAAALAADLARRIGGQEDVLIERSGSGRAACYAPVAVAVSAPVGAVRRMRFVDADKCRLIGEPA